MNLHENMNSSHRYEPDYLSSPNTSAGAGADHSTMTFLVGASHAFRTRTDHSSTLQRSNSMHDAAPAKRNSFFARHEPTQGRVPLATHTHQHEQQHVAHDSQHNRRQPASNQQHHRSRPVAPQTHPASAHHATAHGPRRVKPDPLDSLLKSLFTRQRKASLNINLEDAYGIEYIASPRETIDGAAVGNISRTSTPRSQTTTQFKTQDEYYLHLRKTSISRPYNFQHITHTARVHGPRLQSVDEKNLTAEFWAVSSRPSRQKPLPNIEQDDHAEKSGATSTNDTVSSPNGVSNPPSWATLSPSRTLPSSSAQSHAAHNPSSNGLSSVNHKTDITSTGNVPLPTIHETTDYPRRHSSANALNLDIPSSAAVDTAKLRSSRLRSVSGLNKSSSTSPRRTVGALLQAAAEHRGGPSQLDPHGSGLYLMPNNKALPPTPPNRPNVDTTLPGLRPRTADDLLCGERSLNSLAWTSGGLISSPRTSRPDFSIQNSSTDEIWDAWEDEVDFCYEQQAESTCNFDWINAPRPSTSDSALPLRPHWASEPSPLTSEPDLRLTFSNDSIVDRLASPSPTNNVHKRVSSVGHLGFLAARNVSVEIVTDPNTCSKADSGIGLTSYTTAESMVVGGPAEPKPFAALAVAPNCTNAKAPSMVASVESLRSDNSAYSRSSPYESCRSSNNSSSDVTRWSGTSASPSGDIPTDALANKSSLIPTHTHDAATRVAKDTPSSPLSKSTTVVAQLPIISSTPTALDTLVMSDKLYVPPSPRRDEAGEESAIIRRPQTPGERAAMQASGRIVQRGRPSTPKRFSRTIARPTTPSALGDWI